MTALHYDATTLLSAYMPGKSTASTTRFTTSDSTPPPSNATTVPSNTTTQYITTTTTATATSTISTGNTQSPAATSSAPSTERQAGGAEDTAPRPAPPRRPLSHSANPAVIGGITGTFVGLAVMGIIMFITLRRRKRRTRVYDDRIRARMYERPAYEPTF